MKRTKINKKWPVSPHLSRHDESYENKIHSREDILGRKVQSQKLEIW